ncbi:transglutaminase domain-containing protein [Thermococcus sp. 18S1]|uniref:transglutaminase-like domain-containing protein n=1 Tax=Thermococcus sp. 18S1 TaxID=1638210 RepID=UPI00143C17BD|nr:transglutaminase-like domain-containing protein [Thermococcus sp. 18S1]NJE29646.1 transglutaminase domain-containing protein [Thermococcus sp. 18S1]
MKMRKAILVPLLILIVVVSGCLFKPPAEVRFSVDRTVVAPDGTLHVIVFVNNTGKVGLTGATLVLGDDSFQILQEPKFPDVLPVGHSVQLVWILKAPAIPGYYNLKLSLELTDELKRTWTGFYGQFRIFVSEGAAPSDEIGLEISGPETLHGGETSTITVTIKNKLEAPIDLLDIRLDLLDGMRVVSADALPESISENGKITLRYTVKAPYAYRKGYISTILRYKIGSSEKSVIESVPLEVTWRPWNADSGTLKDAYDLKYHWITDGYLVDGYWSERYNSTPTFNRTELRNLTLKIIGNTSSEPGAAEAIYGWMMRTYSFGDTTSTLEPDKILLQDRLSYAEGQILTTAMLRSIDIPARIVTLYNGTDCTQRPVTEFYTTDGWYVVDIEHGFIGSLEEYLASPYFPRLYQIITEDGYRMVAQSPTELRGHEHVDVTGDFIANLEDRLISVVSGRLKPELRSKLTMVLNNLNENERLYALFLLSSAPNNDDLNRVMEEYSTKKIEQNVKTMYEFYRDMEWSDDFTRYWKIFAGDVG